MKIKALALFLTAALLTGCSLALPEAETAGHDRLVGALVTTEYIDTGIDLTVSRNGRIEIGAPQKVEGVPVYTEGTDHLERVEFPGIEGYTLLMYQYKSREGDFTSNLADDEFYDLGIHTNVTDTGESNTLYGALRVDLSRGGMVHLYTNPIYRTPEGGFYLIPGSGVSTNCEDGQGFKMGQTVEGEFTETFGEEKRRSGSRVELSYEGGYPGERFTLVQIDRENHILREDSWSAEELPERLTLEPEAELALVETHYTDRQGTAHIQPEVYGCGGFITDEETGKAWQVIRLYLPGQDGVCRIKTLELAVNTDQK